MLPKPNGKGSHEEEESNTGTSLLFVAFWPVARLIEWGALYLMWSMTQMTEKYHVEMPSYTTWLFIMAAVAMTRKLEVKGENKNAFLFWVAGKITAIGMIAGLVYLTTKAVELISTVEIVTKQ